MRVKTLVAALVATLCLCSCGTPPAFADLTPEYTTNTENLRNDNLNLAEKLQNKIIAFYPGSEVKVYANGFNVLILGQVKTAELKDQVTALVQSEHGVKEVWNYLTVNYQPKFSLNTKLMDKVRARIVTEKNINPDNIMVEAVGSTVYLLGSEIGNLTYLDRAIRGIYTIDGVDKVVNLTQKGVDDYRSKEDAGF